MSRQHLLRSPLPDESVDLLSLLWARDLARANRPHLHPSGKDTCSVRPRDTHMVGRTKTHPLIEPLTGDVQFCRSKSQPLIVYAYIEVWLYLMRTFNVFIYVLHSY